MWGALMGFRYRGEGEHWGVFTADTVGCDGLHMPWGGALGRLSCRYRVGGCDGLHIPWGEALGRVADTYLEAGLCV